MLAWLHSKNADRVTGVATAAVAFASFMVTLPSAAGVIAFITAAAAGIILQPIVFIRAHFIRKLERLYLVRARSAAAFSSLEHCKLVSGHNPGKSFIAPLVGLCVYTTTVTGAQKY